jgi:uncharacterized protein YodC (DUF2158 family)
MSENPTFKIGDTVSLNSGGHLMTVVAIDDKSVTCDWSERGGIKSKSWPIAALKTSFEPSTLEQLVGASYRTPGEPDSEDEHKPLMDGRT